MNFINILALKTIDTATKYEMFTCLKMILNLIHLLACKMLILQLSMKCLK